MAGTTYTVAKTLKIGGVVFFTSSLPFTNSTSITTDESVPDDQPDYQIDLAITLANVKVLGIQCDKDVEIKTNDSAYPVDTITLAANTSLIWTEDDLGDIPFTENVTALYVTNAGEGDARLKIGFLLVQSP